MDAYRTFLRDLMQSFRWRLGALVLLMALVGLTEGLSVALLLPILTRIGIVHGSGSGIFSQQLEAALQLIESHPGTGLVLAVLVTIAAVQTALSLGMNWWVAKLASGYQAQWRRKLFNAFIAADWLYLSSLKVGDLTNAVVTETMRVSSAFIYFVQVVAAAVVALIYTALALLISVQATLWLVGIALLLMLAGAYLYRMSYGLGTQVGPLNAQLQVLVGEYLSGAKVVKTTGSEDRASARINDVAGKSERVNVVATFLPGALRGVFEFVAFCALVALVVFGAAQEGTNSVNMIVVLALFLRLLPRVSTVQTNLHALNVFIPAVLHMRELLSGARAASEHNAAPERPVAGGVGGLVVENLSVRFDSRTVLDHVSFEVPVPGAVAVIGPSGAGKSTLVHALLGLVPASTGTMRIGAHPFGSVEIRSWRRAIGYVPQETVLFHASVRDNLTLANPQASDAEIEEAARLAHAAEFIAALPQGFDTVIGDQGVLLSGGQRQRLAIARALLAHPVVLLLDEPTSALDADSEDELMKALQQLRSRIGILIVAHRPSTIRIVDRILLLQDGRLSPVAEMPAAATSYSSIKILTHGNVP